MAENGEAEDPERRAGWRRLGIFWLTALLLMAVGASIVEFLGPPGGGAPHQEAASHPPAETHPKPHPEPAVVTAHQAPLPAPETGRDTPGPISDPDPALFDRPVIGIKGRLPRIAADGRAPMRIYAAGFDQSSRRPRVGILLSGIGLNEAESDSAIRTLPGAVSLAVSPYAAERGTNLTRLLSTARTAGHEYLVSVPLEPTGFPLNDPGPSTLLTSNATADNINNLHWALRQFEGYVGATGVTGTMRGERFSGMADQMEAVLTELAERGLLYVDPTEGGGPVSRAWGVHINAVIDDPPDRASIDAKLAALEQQAKDFGSSLGVALRPTPVAVARIAAWANGLSGRGLTLAPVSALALKPADPVIKVSEREH